MAFLDSGSAARSDAATGGEERAACRSAAPTRRHRSRPARSWAVTRQTTAEFGARLVTLQPYLMRRARRLCQHSADAEDLVHETLLRALRCERQFEPGTNLAAWLGSIQFSLFVTHCRQLKRRRAALGLLRHEPLARQPSVVVFEPLLPALTRAVDRLPRQFGEVLRLVEFEDYAYRDAAARLGVPVGTIMSRLHRARRLLLSQLKHEQA